MAQSFQIEQSLKSSFKLFGPDNSLSMDEVSGKARCSHSVKTVYSRRTKDVPKDVVRSDQ